MREGKTGNLAGFVAGFVSTLVFHQGTLAVLHAAGLTSHAAYLLAPTWPFHVPEVLSLAFWGGVWAVVLRRLIGRPRAPGVYWARWLELGAILPSLATWFIVLPLNAQAIAGGGSPEVIAGALLLNGVWGLGAALLLRAIDRLRFGRPEAASGA
jgi:hypothetical protein